MNPFFYLVDLHNILSICTRFSGRGVPLLFFILSILLIEASANESDLGVRAFRIDS